MSGKCGITARQILKVPRKQYPVLIGKKTFENLLINAKVELLNETLLNMFRSYIPNKTIKCDYRQPLWINDNIKRKLKQRTKLTIYFDKNGQTNFDYDKILEKSALCTETLEAKKKYTLNMTSKLADSHTAKNTYWALLNRLLYKKKDTCNTVITS